MDPVLAGGGSTVGWLHVSLFALFLCGPDPFPSPLLACLLLQDHAVGLCS